jgi:2-methylcitrate dehydratase PrpD
MYTERLARFVTDTHDDDIPAGVMAAARDALIDTLGCGLAGAHDPASRITERWLAANGGAPTATVWGAMSKAPPAAAAFVNAVRSHVLDYDDSSLNLRGHPSAVMMSTALAVGEVTQASGKATLAAYACGLEVAAKLSPALGSGHYFKGWHTTATIGIFGAAAIAARLFGLDAAAVRHAFGLAASQACGLTANFGSMTKAFHVGHAARCGIDSAWLAHHGYTANPSIFEGKGNFIATYAGDGAKPLEALLPTLAAPWELDQPGLYRKRFPCCYAAHRPMAALLDLLERGRITTSDIEAIEVGYLPGVQHPMVHHDPQTGLEAKFSTEYCMAAMALDRKVDMDSFEDAAVQRPQVRELMRRVTSRVIDEPGVYNGLTGYNIVRVRAGGIAHEHRMDRTPGSPDWPLVGEELAAKFLSCARRALPENAVQRALDLATRAAALSDIGELLETMRRTA